MNLSGSIKLGSISAIQSIFRRAMNIQRQAGAETANERGRPASLKIGVTIQVSSHYDLRKWFVSGLSGVLEQIPPTFTMPPNPRDRSPFASASVARTMFEPKH